MPTDETVARWRPRPKYQVFISSTYVDLHDEREAVTWEILKARHIPAGMENFPATDDRGWRIIQRTIDSSDYYVVILAGRYGSIDTSAGLSWTHREYRYARDSGIPVLAFIRSDAHITADRSEREHTSQDLLREFKRELESAHLCRRWGLVDELRTQVVQAIQNQINDDEDSGTQRPGWYRGTEIPSGFALDEFARLSSENAELKRELASISDARSEQLSLLSARDGHTELGGTKSATRVRVTVLPHRAGSRIAYPEIADIQAFVNDEEFTIWLELRVANTGQKVAKNLVADFRSDSIKSIEIYRIAPPQALLARVPTGPAFYLNPTEHVYVDKTRMSGDNAFVRQRIKQIPPGGFEDLIRMGFRAIVDSDAGDTDVDLNISFDIRSEDGVCASGSFPVTLRIRGTKDLRDDVALREYADD